MQEDITTVGAGTFRGLARKFRMHLRNLKRDTAGAAAVVAALLFPIVVGGFGLGAETGYQYMLQRKLQHAADLAAHAAGTRLRAGDTEAEIKAAALHVATEAGFIPSSGTISVETPPVVREEFAGLPGTVEVVLTHRQVRFFSAIFIDTPVSMGASAVSQVELTGSVACVLALSASAPGAVTVSGSTAIDLAGCDVASNSNASNAFEMGGSGSLSAGCINTVGQAVAPDPTSGRLTLSQCQAIREFAPVVRDPYASVDEPGLTGACQSSKVGSPSTATKLTPVEDHASGVKSMRFCKGLDLKGRVTFEPGLYIISGGDLTINGGQVDSSGLAELAGQGVTFYLANDAELKISGNAKLNLSAPTTGPFSGLLFFGSHGGGALTHQLNGASGSTFEGAIYTPASLVQFSGNSEVNGCSQIIADRVTFTGNSSLGSHCETSGTSDIETNETVRIIG